MSYIPNTSQTKKILAILKANDEAGLNTLLWGQPGIGKTALINSFANQYENDNGTKGACLRILIGSTIEPQDVLGYLMKGERNGNVCATTAPPDWYYDLDRASENGVKPILFLDEITTAAPSVQAAMLTLIQDRKTSAYTLPEDTLIISAANPAEYAADGVQLAPPLANRFSHINFEPDVESWIEGVRVAWGKYKKQGDKDYGEARIPENEHKIRIKISQYINNHKSELQCMPRQDGNDKDINSPVDLDRAGFAWPSMRSWDNAINSLIKISNNGKITKDLTSTVLQSFIGEKAATAYMLWSNKLKLPDYKTVIETPEKVDWKKLKADELYITIDNVVNSVNEENVIKTFNAFKIALKESTQKDVISNKVLDLIRKTKKIKTETGKNFTKELSQILLQLSTIGINGKDLNTALEG